MASYLKNLKVGSTTYTIDADRVTDTNNSHTLLVTTTGNATIDGNELALKSYVDTLLAANDAMIFKGTIGSSGATVTALPATHNAGWTYKVITAGTYAGVTCEIGDMIICITDGTTANNAHWTVVQTNTDGHVTGPASAVNNRIAVFSGTTGKVIKDSGYTIATSVPSNAKFTDTNTAHSHTAGTGLTISGSGGISGTTTYSANLNSTTSLGTIGNTSKLYAVGVDANGKLCVNVPWTDSDTNCYHGSGSWSGLTYTATPYNNAPELKFTIPTGTTSTTVASGNHTHTITANATDGIFDLTGTSGTNAVTYAVAPYTSAGAGKFDTSTTNPTGTTRLNYGGYLYATKLYSNNKEVLTSHQAIYNLTVKGNNTTVTTFDPNAAAQSLNFAPGSGISVTTASNSITIAHSNSITAGTAGTSSATSGSTLAVPYVTYDAQGHITGKGTHTHTITGFVPTSRTVNGKALSSNITIGITDIAGLEDRLEAIEAALTWQSF